MEKAWMVAFFVAAITNVVFTTAHTAYAQTKKIDTPIYDRCKRNPFLLSVEIYKGDCIVGKKLPQRLKGSFSSFLLLSTPTPVATPTPTPLTVTPTIQPLMGTPEPTIAYSPQSSPAAPVPNPSTGSLSADVLFSMVNNVRVQNGLPVFEKDDRICAVAQSRAPEIYAEIMVNHNMHAGFYARNLPYWATENLIYQKTEAAALNWWMNEPLHRAAILGNSKYSCIACQGDACTEIFTNYLQK